MLGYAAGMTVDQRFLDQIALSRDEYALVVQRLGREPNELELGMFGALWSEHCGYKNSRPLLKLFPTEGARVLTRAGEENAGAVEIGDGWLVAMKVESHNHPSAIEPFQGAATGVGGIIRDIFAMGVRPVALLDSLRFGSLEAADGSIEESETAARNRRLFAGVVEGIGWYGNCIGLPTVGGEAVFAPSYSGNPLVNAMCVGVARVGELVKARADGPGNVLVLVGADTGRDGIHGATFASVELNEQSEERRPAVQVGNPFMEKLLMEACMELVRHDWIVGLQDLGAAGLTSSAIECAAKAGTGLRIDVLKVPRREAGMSAYEVMLSESQERMLVIAKRGCAERVRELFARWELRSDVIGEVTADGTARIMEGERELACLPVRELTSPPQYRRAVVEPAWLASLQDADLAALPDLDLARGAAGENAAERALMRLLAGGNGASKRWIYRQYDHQVMTNTVISPGEADAAVLRIRGTQRGIALSTDGNGRYCYLDPYAGGAIAVAEAARNVVCTGAEPVAVTDCLNFGNPEKPDVYYQLERCISGMAAACRVLDTPVISGNVSLYNETNGEAIYPTPVAGMLGVLEDVRYRLELAFRAAGDEVYLLGAGSAGRALPGNVTALGASEYLASIHGRVAGRPRIDLELDRRVQRVCLRAARGGLLSAAHDCADGGLAQALAECCIAGGNGLDAADLRIAGRADAALFGEEQSRIVVALRPEHAAALRAIAAEEDVPCTALGRVDGDRLRLAGAIDLPVAQLAQVFEAGLPDRVAAPAL
ncbi:MAG TPA: phosphoribosylformylglycinamidine synthase subunit PurL [Dehalococcoidia bacterium]|nr:phosphoribosylformylglycinamidine synthase subunit PurL [Dehalococcoidia bacterium]